MKYIVIKALVLIIIYFPIATLADQVHFTNFKITDKAAFYAGKVFNAIDAEDEIGIFISNDILIGTAIIGDTVPGYFFVAAYGDDTTTVIKDGANSGDELIFKFWDKSEGKEYIVPQSDMKCEAYEGLCVSGIPLLWKDKTSFGLFVFNISEYSKYDRQSLITHKTEQSNSPKSKLFELNKPQQIKEAELMPGKIKIERSNLNFYNVQYPAKKIVLSKKNNKDMPIKSYNLTSSAPSIEITYYPPYGNRIKNLRGVVHNIEPDKNKVLVFIFVKKWIVKPYKYSPLTPINNDGSWQCDITTGRGDNEATKIAAFIVPNNYKAHLLIVGKNISKKLYDNAISYIQISRSIW